MPQPCLWQQTLETTGNTHHSALPAHSKDVLRASDHEEAPKKKRPPWDMSGNTRATATEDNSNGPCWQATGTRAGRNLEATTEVSSWDTRAVAGGPLKSARAQAAIMECASPGRSTKCQESSYESSPAHTLWKQRCIIPIPSRTGPQGWLQGWARSQLITSNWGRSVTKRDKNWTNRRIYTRESVNRTFKIKILK